MGVPVVFVVLVASVVLTASWSPPARSPDHLLAANVGASLLFGLLLASEIWVLATRAAYSEKAENRGTGTAIGLGLPAAFAGAMVAADTDFGPRIAARWWPLLLLGLVLGAVALAFRLWAVVTLGRLFQQHLVVQDGHRLVTAGPYRLVRHPSYTGPIVLFVGIGLVLDNWIGFGLCLLLPIGAYFWRIRVEERLLVSGLGSEYERYRQRTWCLAPGIW